MSSLRTSGQRASQPPRRSFFGPSARGSISEGSEASDDSLEKEEAFLQESLPSLSASIDAESNLEERGESTYSSTNSQRRSVLQRDKNRNEAARIKGVAAGADADADYVFNSEQMDTGHITGGESSPVSGQRDLSRRRGSVKQIDLSRLNYGFETEGSDSESMSSSSSSASNDFDFELLVTLLYDQKRVSSKIMERLNEITTATARSKTQYNGDGDAHPRNPPPTHQLDHNVEHDELNHHGLGNYHDGHHGDDVMSAQPMLRKSEPRKQSLPIVSELADVPERGKGEEASSSDDPSDGGAGSVPKGLNPNAIKVLGREDEGDSAHVAAKEGKEVEKKKKHKPGSKTSKRWAKVKAAKTAIASVKHATNTTSMLREAQASKQAYAVSNRAAEDMMTLHAMMQKEKQEESSKKGYKLRNLFNGSKSSAGNAVADGGQHGSTKSLMMKKVHAVSSFTPHGSEVNLEDLDSPGGDAGIEQLKEMTMKTKKRRMVHKMAAMVSFNSFNEKLFNKENKGAEGESKMSGDDAGSNEGSKPPVTTPSSLNSIGKQSPASRLSSIGLPKLMKAKDKDKEAKQRAIRSKEGVREGATSYFLHHLVLRLDSRFRWWWDYFIMAGLTLYVAIYIPMDTGFGIEWSSASWQETFGHVIDTLFLIDVMLNFCKSYEDPTTKEEITDHCPIAESYLRSWFVVDLVSSVPAWITGSTSFTTRVFKLLKLLRLRRCTMFMANIETTAASHVDPYVVRLLTQLTLFVLLHHCVACAYWAVAWQTPNWSVEDPFSPQQDECGGWCPPVWLDDPLRQSDADYEPAPIVERWSFAMYWAVTTTQAGLMGKPISVQQQLFSSFLIVLGLIVDASLIGSMSKFMENLDAGRASKKAHFDEIDQSLRFRRVPKFLHKRIRDYYEYLWECGHSEQDDKLFDDLPRNLRIQLDLSLKHHLIESVPLFQTCSNAGIVELVQALLPVIVLPNDPIVHQGEPGKEMYFITNGHVKVFIETSSAEPTYLQTLYAGAFFGEIAMMDANSVRTASIRAGSFCELQVLRRENLMKILARFPDLELEVTKFAEARKKWGEKVATEEEERNKEAAPQGKLGSASSKRPPGTKQQKMKVKTIQRITVTRKSSNAPWKKSKGKSQSQNMMDMLNTPPESMHESKMRSLRASFDKDEEEASAKDMTRITGGAGGISKVQRALSMEDIRALEGDAAEAEAVMQEPGSASGRTDGSTSDVGSMAASDVLHVESAEKEGLGQASRGQPPSDLAPVQPGDVDGGDGGGA